MNERSNIDAARIVGVGTAMYGGASSYRIWMLRRDLSQGKREDQEPPERAKLESEYFYVEFRAGEGDLRSSAGPYFTLDDARSAAEQLTYHFRTKKHPTH